VIEVGGQALDARSLTPSISRSHGFRFVHQQNSTFRDLSVAENLAIGHGFETGRGKTINWRRQLKVAATQLTRFGIDCDPAQPLSELSPARQCLVAIARALRDEGDDTPRVLVLDEPTASLPTAEADHLLEALRRYAAAGVAILYVSHRLDEVLFVADTISVLNDGHLRATFPRADTTRERLAEFIAGRLLAQVQTRRQAPLGQPILEVDHLRGGPLRDVSLTVHEGEIVGIAGLLGSGRSTLLRTLFGLRQPEGGRVLMAGKEVAFSSPGDAMAAGVAYIPEERLREAAFASLTVRDNLLIASTPHDRRKGLLSKRAEGARARTLMADYGVRAASPDAPLSSLSGGNQQKVMLARWLCRAPRLMLLDEPSQGVDVGARSEIAELIRESVQTGAAAIVVSSDADELEVLCDRIVFMANGRTSATIIGAESAETLEQMVGEVGTIG
jgi:ribose transport system ATP-binding protein